MIAITKLGDIVGSWGFQHKNLRNHQFILYKVIQIYEFF